jgi:hypothetical protein
MSSFAIYLIGFVTMIGGLAYGASRLGAPPVWIAIGATVMAGLGILMGVTRTKRPDPPAG